MNDDFKDILQSLLDAEAEFLVIGAHAMAIHGAARATGDIDLLLRPSADNAPRVMHALRLFGAPVEAHNIKGSDFEKGNTVYQMGLPPRRIDLLTSADGVDFEGAWRRRTEHQVVGMVIPFIGKADLIANKRATARPKDLADIAMLSEE